MNIDDGKVHEVLKKNSSLESILAEMDLERC